MERTLGTHWGGENWQDLRRFLKISAAFHALGLLVLLFVPTLPNLAPPGVITVDLVASSRLLAGRPGPSAPKPKPPKQAPKILPTEPTTPEPSAQPKPTPPEEKAPEEEQPEDYTARRPPSARRPIHTAG